MKHTSVLILFLTLFFNARSQDSIIKKNGEVVIAKVLEIGISEIKYKRNDIPDGPVYIDYKSSIQSVRFANGVKEIFRDEPPAPVALTNSLSYAMPPMNNQIEIYGNSYTYHHNKINEYKLYDMLNATHDKKIMNLVENAKNAKTAQYVGFGAIPLGMLGYYFALRGTGSFDVSGQSHNYGNGNDLLVAGFCFVAAVACPVTSGIFKFKRVKYNHAAITLYNEKF